MLWVTITIVISFRKPWSRSSMAHVEVGSSAEAGSSRSRTSGGIDRDRPGDAQSLLLTAGQAHPGFLEPVLYLVPQTAGPRAGLTAIARAMHNRCC
jgi:hypothetical protein